MTTIADLANPRHCVLCEQEHEMPPRITYTLQYGAMLVDDPTQDTEVHASDLDELIALIHKNVERDDYCWILVMQHGLERGRGQYYNTCAPCELLDIIEEQDAAVGLGAKINAQEKAMFAKFHPAINEVVA